MRLKEEQLRREEEKVSIVHILVYSQVNDVYVTAARDRAACPARNQREETGTTREGRVSQVSVVIPVPVVAMALVPPTRDLYTDVIMYCRNLESRLAAQGSQAEFQ